MVELNDPMTVCKAVEDLVTDINNAKKSIKIYAGELHRQIFSDPEVLEALRLAKQRGVEIQILSSPVLSAWLSKRGPYAPILELKKEGIIKLRWRQTRGPQEEHFRLIDAKYAVIEDYHEPLCALHKRQPRRSKDKNEINSLKEKFDQGWKQGNPKGDPLLLTPSEIEKIAMQGNYDTMRVAKIKELLKQVRREEEEEEKRERERTQRLRATFEKFV